MTLRVLADENVDHRVVYRLDHYGHDVEHVDFVPELGKGSDDGSIAEFSLEEDRLILTNDDDFLTDFDSDKFRGLLFIEDETLSVDVVAEIVHAIADTVHVDQIDGPIYVNPTWL